MEPRRRNPLRRYPTAVCISVWHFGLTQSKTRALNSPALPPKSPKLNPTENLSQDLRDNWLSNRVFASGHHIVEYCCDAWTTRRAAVDHYVDRFSSDSSSMIIMRVGITFWFSNDRTIQPELNASWLAYECEGHRSGVNHVPMLPSPSEYTTSSSTPQPTSGGAPPHCALPNWEKFTVTRTACRSSPPQHPHSANDRVRAIRRQRYPEAPSCQRPPPATPSDPEQFRQIASRPTPGRRLHRAQPKTESFHRLHRSCGPAARSSETFVLLAPRPKLFTNRTSALERTATDSRRSGYIALLRPSTPKPFTRCSLPPREEWPLFRHSSPRWDPQGTDC